MKSHFFFFFFAAEILEHPQAQYVLVSDKTTVYCKTIGQDAFWLINNKAISETHLATKRRYESLGFSFGDSDHGTWGYHNLTMNVSASESINSTTIKCIVVDHNFHQIESNAAYLYIFTDIRKYSKSNGMVYVIEFIVAYIPIPQKSKKCMALIFGLKWLRIWMKIM